MSTAEGVSLLAHLKTPVLVGDPDGRIVYANPSFRSRFCEAGDDPMGQPLAMVFGGGAREVVLKATAEVLQRGQSARLQIREGSYGYLGLASPIEAEDDRVGVVMVLLEEQSNEDYLTGLADEVAEPINRAIEAMQGLAKGFARKRGPRGAQSFNGPINGLHQLFIQRHLHRPHVGALGHAVDHEFAHGSTLGLRCVGQ